MPKRSLRTREDSLKERKRNFRCCIVTEGERTEPEYFEWFLSNNFRDARKAVVVAGGGKKTSPKQVLEKAEAKRKEYPNATVFIVIDEDDRPKQELQEVFCKCNKFGTIDNKKINCIFF